MEQPSRASRVMSLIATGAIIGIPAAVWVSILIRELKNGIAYAYETGSLLALVLSACVTTIIIVTAWYIESRFTRWRKRRRDWWRTRNWECCQYCRYDLTPQPDEGVCPECGARYRKAECIAFWRSYAGNNPLSKTGAGYADPPPPTPAAKQRQ